MRNVKALSLFSNVGIAETLLPDAGVRVVAANEIDPKRAEFYSASHPKARMFNGDVTDPSVKDEIVEEAKSRRVRLVIATPPCQGMSLAGARRGIEDARNFLICDAVEIIKRVNPEYVFFENVPQQLDAVIPDSDGTPIAIPDYLARELGSDYFFNLGGMDDRRLFRKRILNAADYGVPQTRRRAIFLLTRKDKETVWEFPEKDSRIRTLRDSIGDLPIADPFIRDLSHEETLKVFPDFDRRLAECLEASPLHKPPTHVLRHVVAMSHTPTGRSAFGNIPRFRPLKPDGTPASGFPDTYMRQSWDKPACTVTSNNGSISSHTNVHPGRPMGKDSEGFDLWSDPRAFTLFELIRVSSLPDGWTIPDGFSERFVRKVIGEGIPPLLAKRVMDALPE